MSIKFEAINGQLCRMVEPEPIFGSTKAPFVIVGKNTKHPTIITQDMDILLRIFLVAYSDEFEIIGYPVEDGSHWWALYQMMQGKWVYNPSLEKHKSDKLDTRYLHAYGKFGQDIVVKNTLTGIDSILGAANISHWTNYAEPSGWQIYEPEPEFKVGDWWEHSSGSHHRIVKVDKKSKTFEIDDYEFPTFYLHNGYEVPDGIERGSYITRKLDPSEVIVNIGCLSGTVELLTWKRAGFNLTTKHGRCWILLDALDAPTRELVESLLKAQNKGDIK